MAFWENIGEAITAKSKEMADKAKNFTDIASLKGQIVSQENIILRQYKEIGREYYAAHKNDDSAEFAALMEGVKKAEGIIEELKKKIADLNGTKHCDACNSEVADDSAFCPKCGAKMEDAKDDEFYDDEDTAEVIMSEIIDDEDDESDILVTESTDEV